MNKTFLGGDGTDSNKRSHIAMRSLLEYETFSLCRFPARLMVLYFQGTYTFVTETNYLNRCE